MLEKGRLEVESSGKRLGMIYEETSHVPRGVMGWLMRGQGEVHEGLRGGT